MPVLAIRIAALVPMLAGAAGAVGGSGFLGEAARPAIGSHLRYLSGVLLGIGLLAWWCAAALPRRAPVFQALCAIVTLGGISRLAGLALAGVPPWPHVLALGMELVVVPLLWLCVRRAHPT